MRYLKGGVLRAIKERHTAKGLGAVLGRVLGHHAGVGEGVPTSSADVGVVDTETPTHLAHILEDVGAEFTREARSRGRGDQWRHHGYPRSATATECRCVAAPTIGRIAGSWLVCSVSRGTHGPVTEKCEEEEKKRYSHMLDTGRGLGPEQTPSGLHVKGGICRLGYR